MVSVLVNWAYVFVVTYILGYFTLTRAYRFFKYDTDVKIGSAVAAGLAVTTVYAGFFSIFYKVGLVANLIMIIACVAMVVVDLEHYKSLVYSVKRPDSESKNTTDEKTKVILTPSTIKWTAFIVVFILALFYTTEGSFFSDSGYYHEQSIRWIEEFGTVKGSVHILKRLAYNSCYFVQCALFSMRELWGQSLHCLGGFYAIFLMGYGIFGFNKNIKLNVLRIAPIIYFLLFCSEITSPASDFPLVFVVMYVAIRWWELIDEERTNASVNSYAPYALLAMFVVFIISIKLTVGCLVFIVLFPAIDMIKGKKIKEIFVSIIAGLVIILPYFIRNYIICGWLIYPFTKVDLFNPIWKIAADAAQADADEIKIWGRGMGQLGGQVNDSIKTWLPHWWEYMSGPNRLIILSFILVSAMYVVYRTVKVVTSKMGLCKLNVVKHVEENGDSEMASIHVWEKKASLHKLIFEVALILSLAMWFLESPLFRYGIAYILVGGCYMIGDILEYVWGMDALHSENVDATGSKALKNGWLIRTVTCVALVVLLMPAIKSLKDYISWDIECVRYYSDYTYWVKQEDYPRVEYVTKEMEGITFYCPEEDMGQIGYHIFPAIWHYETGGIHKLGNDIKDGFYYEADN
ncbi:MAG: hypothetical protein Q4D29_06920 [Lachnospiraceae bacterium]|nr:hypothetical protein [Lachnospiraceae bacterium]